MNWSIGKRVTTAFALAFVSMVVIGVLAFNTTQALLEDVRALDLNHEILRTIKEIDAALKQAESAHRGYALSQDEQFLEEFQAGAALVEDRLTRLRSLTMDNPEQKQHLESLEALANARITHMRDALVEFENGTVTAESKKRLTDAGAALMTKVATVLLTMEGIESKLLSERRTRQELLAGYTLAIVGAGGFIVAILLLSSMLLINRQVTVRRVAQGEIEVANERLSQWVEELERRNKEITLLSTLTTFLQACRTPQETYDVITKSMQRSFPNTSGTLGVSRASRNLVAMHSVWGKNPPPQEDFDPNMCWALRRGRTHIVTDPEQGLVCEHMDVQPRRSYLCMPLTAHGEMLGVMTLIDLDASWEDDTRSRLAETMSENLGMALANLQLRERLIAQAITDPLTGLYNRRYLEESVIRELSRARRHQTTIGIILLDIDRFKSFNDTHGHHVGDQVLQSLGNFLKAHVRGSDIACRYGGEEFALVMPDSPLEKAIQRAEELREKVKYLSVQHQGGVIGHITLSLGVSSFPLHGATLEGLLLAADNALYRAKAEGRDKVCVAEEAPVESEEDNPVDDADQHPQSTVSMGDDPAV